MSFDLLAEFGSPPPPQGQQKRAAPHHQSPPAAQPGQTSFSLFDDLAGLNQPSASFHPPAVAATSFNNGVSSFAPQGSGLSPVTGAPPTSTQAAASNDDDWGDFADASTPAQSAALPSSTSINTTSQAPDPWASLRTSTSLTGTNAPSGIAKPPAPHSALNPSTSKSDPFDFSAFGVPSRPQSTSVPQSLASPPPVAAPAPGPSKPAAPRDPNVLFDAENLSGDDDDFGDFEDATPGFEQPAPAPVSVPAPVSPPQPVSIPISSPPPKAAPSAAPATAKPLNIDALLGELEVADPLTSVAPTSKKEDWKTSTSAKFAAKSQTSQPAAFGATKPPPAKATSKGSTSKARMTNSKPIGQPLGFDDDWDDLIPTTPAAAPASVSSPLPTGFDVPAPAAIPDPAPNSLPPTNIPPPALLLTLFPPIFASAHTSFFKPLGTQPTHVRPKILSDQAVVRFLRGYLSVAIVAARVIAGRKLRWKRDTFLAQGMRIGQAGRAGAGGMKLTAIDRSESTKEDREAADVVRAWKEQVGRLRSVVAQVNGKDERGRSVGAIPELSETMPIRTAKELEGGIAAPKPCALCGLKRNERIGKVDVDVEDSFGEWWVDQLSMHRACRNFWEEHKEKLRY
ncbi:hypothetical protein MPH_05629 [Macrophomina phaseolina MS6]|uniref:Serine/threonine-protein kinase ppk6 n=1 Tax=Macrophomina phaseolina (strain MS6) TaxID=1126212 RepID=K2SK40_MACPH|nr:hypothetical protein MPH_05629 [Macrophomina phaseolina MS6]